MDDAARTGIRFRFAVAAAAIAGVMFSLLGFPSSSPRESDSSPSLAQNERESGELEILRGLRDEAEALTPAALYLDESVATRWLPVLGEVEHALADPRTRPAQRRELRGIRDALETLFSPPAENTVGLDSAPSPSEPS